MQCVTYHVPFPFGSKLDQDGGHSRRRRYSRSASSSSYLSSDGSGSRSRSPSHRPSSKSRRGHHCEESHRRQKRKRQDSPGRQQRSSKRSHTSRHREERSKGTPKAHESSPNLKKPSPGPFISGSLGVASPRPVDGSHEEGKASNTADMQETTPHQSTSVESTPVSEDRGLMDEIGIKKRVAVKGDRGDLEFPRPKYSSSGPCIEMGDGTSTPEDVPADTEASVAPDESPLSHLVQEVARSPRSKQDKTDRQTKEEGADEGKAVISKRHRDASGQREDGDRGGDGGAKRGRPKEVVSARGESSRKRERDGDRLKEDGTDRQSKREHTRECGRGIDDAKQATRTSDKESVRSKQEGRLQTKEGRERDRDDTTKDEGRRVRRGGKDTEEGSFKVPVREVTKIKEGVETEKDIAVETKRSKANPQKIVREAKHSTNVVEVEVSKVTVSDDVPEVKRKRSVVILKNPVPEKRVAHDRVEHNHIKDASEHGSNSKEKRRSREGCRVTDGGNGSGVSAALSHVKGLASHHRHHSRLDGRRPEDAGMVDKHEERTQIEELVPHEGSPKIELLPGDRTTRGIDAVLMARRPSEDDAIELHVMGTIDVDLSDTEPVCLTDSQKLSSLVVRRPDDKAHKHKHKEKRKKKHKKSTTRSDKSRHR